MQNVVNGFVNVTKAYNVSAYKNYSSNSTLNVAPYYALDSVCGCRACLRSYYSVLNATSAGLNTTLNGCSYYVVASPIYAVARVHDYQRYVLHYSAAKAVQVPAIYASGGRVQRSGFLPGSLYYIASLYANETA
ncbi:MAG: hypothetical protein QXG73_03420 [Candidatus Micrarchaeaceae archaeon]